MREILFRGQTRRYGEKVKMNGEKVPSNWVYGGVCQGKGDFSIIYGSMDMGLEQPTEKRVVYTDTIGQYTGLTDKNGTKIFEGDIVNFKTINYHFKNCRIKYQSCYARYCAIDNKGYEYPMDKTFEYEVIGNIHDNPELLKEREG